MLSYSEIYMRLQFESAVVTFKKKDGTLRVMLCTRNIYTGALVNGDSSAVLGRLAGHDKRCSIANGNLAVFDLIIGETRSFNAERVLDIKFLGEIKTTEQLDEACGVMKETEEQFKDWGEAEDSVEQVIALERARMMNLVDTVKEKPEAEVKPEPVMTIFKGAGLELLKSIASSEDN